MHIKTYIFTYFFPTIVLVLFNRVPCKIVSKWVDQNGLRDTRGFSGGFFSGRVRFCHRTLDKRVSSPGSSPKGELLVWRVFLLACPVGRSVR